MEASTESDAGWEVGKDGQVLANGSMPASIFYLPYLNLYLLDSKWWVGESGKCDQAPFFSRY